MADSGGADEDEAGNEAARAKMYDMERSWYSTRFKRLGSRRHLHFWHAVEYERQTIQRAVKALPSTHKTAAKASTDVWDVLFPEGSSAAAKPLQKKWAVYIEWLKLVTAVLLALAGGRVMRRLREDHLQLKPEIDEVKSIKLSKALQKAYDIICDDQRKARRRKRTETRISGSQGSNDDDDDDDDGEEGSGRGTLRASLPAGFDTLKRILLVDPARIKKKYGRIPSPKVAISIKICKTILDKDQHLPVKRQRKIAIFCEWSESEVIARITRKFKVADVPVAVLNGRIPDVERAEIIEKFQRDHDHRATCGKRSRIILFSQASSAGVNLHRASVLITLDNMWTFAKREQIEGRVLRLGQTRPVAVYRIVAQNTIDEGLIWHQMRKRQLMEEMDKMWCSKVTPLRHEKAVMPCKPTSRPPTVPPALKNRKAKHSKAVKGKATKRPRRRD